MPSGIRSSTPRQNARPMSFPDEVADAVREKQQEDQVEIAKLIARGTPVARINTGIDGGMNRVFASKLPDGSTGLSEGGEGQGLSLLRFPARPAPSPRHVNPPRGPVTSPDPPLVASMTPATAPAPATRVASAAPAPRNPTRLLQQPRPQGRPRLCADTTATAQPPRSSETEGDRGQAATPSAFDPKSSEAPEVKQAAVRPPLNLRSRTPRW